MAEPPPPPAADSSTKYHGIPDDYVVPQNFPSRSSSGSWPANGNVQVGTGPSSVSTPGMAGTPLNAQRYKKGDEYSIAQGRSPEQIYEMQQELIAAGLMPKGKQFRAGQWDGTTSDAYKKALEFANQQGLQAGDAIERLKSSPMEEVAKDIPTLQYELPNREDVKAITSKVARSQLGRNLDPESQERIAAAYEAEVMRVQQQNFQQQAIDGAKTYQAPDQNLFAAQQIRKQNPGEAAAHDYASQYADFSDLINSSAAAARSGM